MRTNHFIVHIFNLIYSFQNIVSPLTYIMIRLKLNTLIQVYMASMASKLIKQMVKIGTKMVQGPYGGMVMVFGLLVTLKG